MNSGPFQVICKYPSDENIDNEDFDSIEAEIKDKHFGDQVTFYTIRPGHNNIENNNLVIGEFSAPKWINRNHIIELVKETVSKYVTVLEIISISRFDDWWLFHFKIRTILYNGYNIQNPLVYHENGEDLVDEEDTIENDEDIPIEPEENLW